MSHPKPKLHHAMWPRASLVAMLAICSMVSLARAQSPDVKAAAQSALNALNGIYGGRVLHFADLIDADSRRVYLAQFDKTMLADLKKLDALPQSEEMAKIVAKYQDKIVQPDESRIKIDSNHADVPMKFTLDDLDNLVNWWMVTQANAVYLNQAMQSIQNHTPAPDVKAIVKKFLAKDHPARDFAIDRARMMQKKHIFPVPNVVHLVREDRQWKLDLAKYKQDMQRIGEKVKGDAKQP